MDVLKASNLGAPVTLADSSSAPARGYLDARAALRGNGADDHSGEKRGFLARYRTEGSMSIFRSSASRPRARTAASACSGAGA